MSKSRLADKLSELTKRRNEYREELARTKKMKDHYYYQKDWVKDYDRLLNKIKEITNEITYVTKQLQQEIYDSKRGSW